MRERYDAHLTGLLAHYTESVNQVVNSWTPEDIQESVKKAREQANLDVATKFKERIESRSEADKVHWISRRGQGDTTVAKYARFYDLTILGRYDAVHGEDQQELHPDMITMVSGRPVMLIPREFDMSTFNEHAVIAWDGKRASARALADAMHILKTMRQVTIVTVDDGHSAISLPEIDVETALQRHGVNTEKVNLERNGRSAGYRILEFLEQAQANLLVMAPTSTASFASPSWAALPVKCLKKQRFRFLFPTKYRR